MWTISTVAIFLFASVVYVSNAQTSVQWSGYQWFLRNDQNSGPGPNNWTSTNVWVDTNNYLHLKLAHSSATGRWTCAELYTTVQFNFGTFRWFVEGAIDKLDTNVVFGLFTYGGLDGTNEIDIEAAKWGQKDPAASSFFYTVYPRRLGAVRSVSSGTRLSLQGTYTTHQFVWSCNNVTLQIQGGFTNSPQIGNAIFSYTTPNSFSPIMPYVGAPLHMNLWLFQGHPPTNGQEVEIIIHSFSYTAA